MADDKRTKLAKGLLEECDGDVIAAIKCLTVVANGAAAKSSGRAKDGLVARGVHGPSRRPLKMPTAEQKAAERADAASAARKVLAVETYRIRDGRLISEVRFPELRAIGQRAATIGGGFILRGVEDFREAFLAAKCLKYTVPSNPNAAVGEVIKPAILQKLYEAAEVEARQAAEKLASTTAHQVVALADLGGSHADSQ